VRALTGDALDVFVAVGVAEGSAVAVGVGAAVVVAVTVGVPVGVAVAVATGASSTSQVTVAKSRPVLTSLTRACQSPTAIVSKYGSLGRAVKLYIPSP
jgi:hypothetical protein